MASIIEQTEEWYGSHNMQLNFWPFLRLDIWPEPTKSNILPEGFLAILNLVTWKKVNWDGIRPPLYLTRRYGPLRTLLLAPAVGFGLWPRFFGPLSPKNPKNSQKWSKNLKKLKNKKNLHLKKNIYKHFENVIFLCRQKKCYTLSFPILGGRDSTRALQYSPIQNPGGAGSPERDRQILNKQTNENPLVQYWIFSHQRCKSYFVNLNCSGKSWIILIKDILKRVAHLFHAFNVKKEKTKTKMLCI